MAAPCIVANTYLKGSYTEHYSAIERNQQWAGVAVSPILLAVWNLQPGHAGNPRLYP